jgi:hypothetical protein
MVSIFGIVILVFLGPFDLMYISILAVGSIVILMSSYVQAFVKTQISMFMGTIALLFGLETQKFVRLASTR